MREGIIDQLPRALAKDQVIAVFGPSDDHGLNEVKGLIDRLNRPDEWIKGTFRDRVSEDKVSQKAAIVLTMKGLNHGVLTTIRSAAELAGVYCPNQALTPGEVKEILRLLADVRGKGVSILTGSHNGNGNHPAPGKSEAQRLDDLTKSAKQTGEAFTSVLQNLPEMPTPSEPAPPAVPVAEVPSEVQSAIAAIEKLQAATEETHLALLVIGDGLKAGSAERIEFEKRLAERDEAVVAKEAEITDLRNQLATVTEEKESFRKKNDGLTFEINRLRNTLDQFENMIKGVRQK